MTLEPDAALEQGVRPRQTGMRASWPGLVVLGLVVLVALAAPWITSFDPERAEPAAALLPPSGEHWFGTNIYGGDVFSRVVHAARLDLFIGFTSVLLSFTVAAPIGAAAGYFNAWWAPMIMRVMDFVQSFPLFIVALALVSVSTPSTRNVITVLAVLNIPIFVRLIRGEVLTIRSQAFIEAARCIDKSAWRIIARHVLPNALGPATAQASANVGWALLLTAGLSFVGAGVQPPTPEWGLMIGEGARQMITGEWWIAFFPGLALGTAVYGFASLGDWLRFWSDAQRRASR